MRCLLLVAALAVTALGCKTQDSPLADPPPVQDTMVPADAASQPTSQPVEPSEDMYEPTFGERTTVVGVLDMARVAGGKRLQPTVLEPDGGGEVLLLSYRPVAAWYGFVERRVRVTGRPYTPSPYTQHVNGSHFEVEAVELEDGGEAPTVDSLPPATKVATLEALPAPGRWVRIVGTLQPLPSTEDAWTTVTVDLEDGTRFHADVRVRQARGHDGKMVSCVGQLDVAGTRTLVGQTALCAGDDARCGQEGR